MPTGVPVSIRRAAEAATLQFDWLLPADKPMLRVADIVAATGMKTTFIEELFAEKCHRYEKPGAARPPMRIPRAFAVELLVKSAKYAAADKVDAVASCFREFEFAELLELQKRLDAEIRRKGVPANIRETPTAPSAAPR